MNDMRTSSAFPLGLFESPFKPAWWLRNNHAQTLFSTLFRSPIGLPRTRETVALADGDFLDIDFFLPVTAGETTPMVLIVHGLSGSSESHYVLGLQHALAQQGWSSAAMNCRGASGRANNLPRAYHAGSSDDILAVLQYLEKRNPQSPLAVVGYSLGGNMTLKMMAEQRAPVFAGVAVSVPLLLSECADRMDTGFSRIYRQHFMSELTRMWQEKLPHLAIEQGNEAVQKIQHCLQGAPFKSFWQYDNEVVAPLHGFKGVHDYYKSESSRQFLVDIKSPTLLIQSADDPFMSERVLPTQKDLSPAVHFELSRKGGHVGFIEGGTPRQPAYYLERRIPGFLRYCLEK